MAKIGIKEAKAYFSKQIEDAYKSIVDDFVEMRKCLREFKKRTKEETDARATQLGYLEANVLETISQHFASIEKGTKELFSECEHTYFTIKSEHRRTLHSAMRPVKYLLMTVFDRVRGRDPDHRLALVGFWAAVESVSKELAVHALSHKRWGDGKASVIEAIFDELARYENAIKQFKVLVTRHVGSADFTTVIHRERLIERWQIGDKQHEGENRLAEANADARDDDPNGGIAQTVEYEHDAKINEKDDTDAAERTRLEAIEFMKMADDVEEVTMQTVGKDGKVKHIPLPARSIARGEKILRKRSRAQIEHMKKLSKLLGDGDDDDDDEDSESPLKRQQTAAHANGDDDATEDDGAFEPDKHEDSDIDSDDANDASQCSDECDANDADSVESVDGDAEEADDMPEETENDDHNASADATTTTNTARENAQSIEKPGESHDEMENGNVTSNADATATTRDVSHSTNADESWKKATVGSDGNVTHDTTDQQQRVVDTEEVKATAVDKQHLFADFEI